MLEKFLFDWEMQAISKIKEDYGVSFIDENILNLLINDLKQKNINYYAYKMHYFAKDENYAFSNKEKHKEYINTKLEVRKFGYFYGLSTLVLSMMPLVFEDIKNEKEIDKNYDFCGKFKEFYLNNINTNSDNINFYFNHLLTALKMYIIEKGIKDTKEFSTSLAELIAQSNLEENYNTILRKKVNPEKNFYPKDEYLISEIQILEIITTLSLELNIRSNKEINICKFLAFAIFNEPGLIKNLKFMGLL